MMLALVACGDRSGDHEASSLQGLRTAVYAAPDLARAKLWYTEALGIKPYFDEAFYVGFNVGGFELALDPNRTGARPEGSGVVVYWGVDDVEAEFNRLLDMGARPHQPVQDVGGDIRVASVLDPFGNPLGLIYNPHFEIID
jgi:predicted enzyme related to lactoylglutathione lyase